MAEKMYYLQVPGAPGESVAPGHEGWIEVFSFSFGTGGGTVSPTTGSSGGAGTWNEIDASMNTGYQSSELLLATASGKHFGTVFLDVPEGSGFRRYTLVDTIATSFRSSDSQFGDDLPIETVAFQSAKPITTELVAAPPAKPIDPKSPAGQRLAKIQKQAVIHIRVLDQNGKERVPKGGDAVSARDKLKYDPKEGYVRLLEGKGELTVSVSYDGFQPLQQRFRYDAPAERPVLAPYWPGTDEDPDAKGERKGHLLACMQLTRVAGGHEEQRSPKAFHLTVTLHPTRMAVAVIGCDYWESPGTPHEKRADLDFDKYAQTYARYLTAANRLNLSSPMTVIDCQRGRVERWDRVRAGDSSDIVWKRHYIMHKKEPCPRWSTGKAYDAWRTALAKNPSDARKYFGATDVYYHLSDLGRRTPGAVVDFSIFSHAWHGGPILYNTGDPDDADPARFAGDLDMRFTKDFKAPNVGGWSKMPDAFASDAIVFIWGCFATDVFNKMARFLLGEGGTKGRFIYKEGATNLDLDRNGVVAKLKQIIEAANYMARIAKFTGRDTYGGLPGFGAENEEYTKIATTDRKLRVSGPISHVPRITAEARFRKLFESAELGSHRFNQFGYMLYKP